VILFGVVIDPRLEGNMKVTVIATGFGSMRRREDTMPGKESLEAIHSVSSTTPIMRKFR
jgi:cell division GTPase FtsZ